MRGSNECFAAINFISKSCTRSTLCWQFSLFRHFFNSEEIVNYYDIFESAKKAQQTRKNKSKSQWCVYVYDENPDSSFFTLVHSNRTHIQTQQKVIIMRHVSFFPSHFFQHSYKVAFIIVVIIYYRARRRVPKNKENMTVSHELIIVGCVLFERLYFDVVSDLVWRRFEWFGKLKQCGFRSTLFFLFCSP